MRGNRSASIESIPGQVEPCGGVSRREAAGLRDTLDHNPCVGPMRAGARRFWTGREERLLRQHYPVGGLNACLPVLEGRSASSIYQRAGQLGLRSPVAPAERQNWTGSDAIDAVIRRAYQATPTKGDVLRVAKTVGRPRWWLRAKRRGTERVAVQGGDEWWIHRRDVRSFIVENVAAVDLRKVDKFWFVDLLTDSTARAPEQRAAA